MKRTIATLAVCLLAICSQAQSAGKAGQTAKKTMGFIENFDLAKKEASAFKQPIFAFFTGSDWCPFCMKLRGEVIDKKEFKKFAEDNLILFEADFPLEKKQSSKVKQQNEALAAKYKVDAYPTVFLLDAEGKELGQAEYQGDGAEAYVKGLKEVLAKAGVKTTDRPAAAKAAPAGEKK